MSSYFASLTSSTTISSLGTRLNSLRRAITSGEEADDPDNEDSSHISNVLRAYYAENGRPFPQWLPPDPKTPTPQPRMVVTQASYQQGNNAYGQGPGQPAPPRGGGLGDLWSDGPSQPPPSQTASLRNRPVRGPVASANLRPMQSQTPPPESISRRPLPSQRAGSYQSASSAQSQPQSQSGYGMEKVSSGSSAQQRLRARFHGGAGHSPSPPPQSQSPYMRSSRS